MHNMERRTCAEEVNSPDAVEPGDSELFIKKEKKASGRIHSAQRATRPYIQYFTGLRKASGEAAMSCSTFVVAASVEAFDELLRTEIREGRARSISSTGYHSKPKLRAFAAAISAMHRAMMPK